MVNLKVYKKVLRKAALELRCGMPSVEVHEKSSRIIDRLEGLKEFRASNSIMCYADFKNEVETRDFIKKCLESGKQVAVPSIITAANGQKSMIASEITDIDSDLEKGTYGFLEPRNDSIRMMEPLKIDLVVVPGVLFDIRRHRLGYGGGYYDRYLKMLRSDCFKVGIAFENQISDEVPLELHDVPLNMIITEDRYI